MLRQDDGSTCGYGAIDLCRWSADGGDKPLKSICPFCLSEEWNGKPKKGWLTRLRHDVILGLRAISLEMTIIGAVAVFFAVMAIYRFVFVGLN